MPPAMIAFGKAARMDDRWTNSLPSQSEGFAWLAFGLQAMKALGFDGSGRSLVDHQTAFPPWSASHVCQVSRCIAAYEPDW